MGNVFDEEEWWLARYVKVKTRIALWPSIRRLSITGRNTLLQAVYYGSFRYWLYCLTMPQFILDIIQEDANLILWKSQPKPLSNELGSSERTRPWIAGDAKYLKIKEGGAGLMHWPSHCDAFYAQWIIRFLHPREAAWKHILTFWLEQTDESDLHAKQSLLARPGTGRKADVPHTARYIRKCIDAFEALQLTQDIRILDHTFQAESIFENNRFAVAAEPDDVSFLVDDMDVTHNPSLLDPQSTPFTPHEWGRFIDEAMPDEINNAPSNERDKWRKRQFDMINLILNTIPHGALNRCVPPPIPDGSYVAISRDRSTIYAIKHGAQYERVWLDASRKPHLDGSSYTPTPQDLIQPVEVWEDAPSEPESDDEERDAFEADDAPRHSDS